MGGMAQMRKTMASMVSRASLGVAKRLRRAQAMGPLVLTGAPRASTMSWRTKEYVMSVLLSLDQRNARIVPVHEGRGRQGQGQVDRHGDGDDLDGLAGLVQRGSHEDIDQLGIADGGAERGVLRQVEIL